MNTLTATLRKANIEAQRRCGNPFCTNQFVPQRVDQRFCQGSCRRLYTRLAYRVGIRVLELLESVKGGNGDLTV